MTRCAELSISACGNNLSKKIPVCITTDICLIVKVMYEHEVCYLLDNIKRIGKTSSCKKTHRLSILFLSSPIITFFPPDMYMGLKSNKSSMSLFIIPHFAFNFKALFGAN